MRKFTIAEIRILAEINRRMDSGEQPYVIAHNDRMAVEPEIMDELNLVSGQTVSRTIALAIMEARVASLKARIELARLA